MCGLILKDITENAEKVVHRVRMGRGTELPCLLPALHPAGTSSVPLSGSSLSPDLLRFYGHFIAQPYLNVIG
jgi:hypothetical protein